MPRSLVLALALAAAGCGSAANSSLDTDGDSLSDQEELEVHGTNPELADSDGDGLPDGLELGDLRFDPELEPHRFNPLVADLPDLEIELTGEPVIIVKGASTSGVETVAETSLGTASGSSSGSVRTTQAGLELERSSTLTQGLSATLSSEIGVQGVVPSASVGAELTASFSEARTSTQRRSTMSSFSNETSLSQESTLQKTMQFAEEESQSLTGGELRTLVAVKNVGHTTVTLTDLSLSATFYEASTARRRPIGSMVRDAGVSGTITLDPGAASENLVFATGDLALETVLDLLGAARGIELSVASFDVVDDQGRSFKFNAPLIAQNTAEIVIDFAGERGPMAFNVCTTANPAQPWISLERALGEVLRLDVGYGAGGHVASIQGLSEDLGPRSAWIAVHSTTRLGERSTQQFDPRDGTHDVRALRLRAGDTLNLAFVSDEDADGLGLRQERLWGSDPSDQDTDDDGLSDAVDVAAGWSPLDSNSDGDAYSDADETVVGFWAHDQSAFAVTVGGQAWTWGNDSNAELPRTARGSVSRPVRVDGDFDRRWDKLQRGVGLQDGTIYTWGEAGPLRGTGNVASGPAAMTALPGRWTDVARGGDEVLAVREDGTLWHWGGVSDPTTSPRTYANAPVRLGTDRDWVKVWANTWNRYAQKKDGSLYAWGWKNDEGQLGLGHEESVDEPVRHSDGNWVDISDGGLADLTFGVRDDGSLWVWGVGGSSAGQATTARRSYRPTRVGDDRDWVRVAKRMATEKGVGDSQVVYGLKSDGTLWTWGFDDGSTGLGPAGRGRHQLTPKRLVWASDWAAIHSHGWGVTGLRANGRLYTWGTIRGERPSPAYGLGDDARAAVSTPTLIDF